MTNENFAISSRAILRRIIDAGIAAVAPDGAVLRHLHRNGNLLTVNGHDLKLSSFRRIFVIGAGKGAAPMAAALEKLLGDCITDGLIIVKYDHGLPLQRIRLAEAAHPIPDQSGMNSAQEMVAMARQATADDLIICLFTGGASALTPALWPGLALEDLRTLTGLLLESGATIHEINTIRKHLSSCSGGRLAQAAAPATAVSLIVSDVVGDNLDVIASGPTVPDPTSFADCARILDKFRLWAKLPPAIAAHLNAGLAGKIPETPKAGDPAFAHVSTHIIASLSQALEAAAGEAEKLGYTARILCADMTGEARTCAATLIRTAQKVQRSLKASDAPCCLLAGGETTVTLHGNGLGGRNQEMALAGTLLLENEAHISMACVGTDGTDGPTDAAGGFADRMASRFAKNHDINLEAALDNNDSYSALDRLGTLLRTGPTRTNVMDMSILLIEAGDNELIQE